MTALFQKPSARVKLTCNPFNTNRRAKRRITYKGKEIMTSFAVIVTRDITESTVIYVDANDAEIAADAALERVADDPYVEWETDDSAGKPYVSHVRRNEA